MRWNGTYLTDLAKNEGSFCAEYRLDPKPFNILHEMISPLLISVIDDMANLSMSK
jgi:hypothetical protein